MNSKIKEIRAKEILDSRGNPTVKVNVFLENGIKCAASVASGASTGKFEALELRDRNASRYLGMGVLKACENVNKKINKVLKGLDVIDQKKIDKIMINLDGTSNKSNLGANATLGVSLACAKAGALATSKPLYKYLLDIFSFHSKDSNLPIPMFNILNGGKHSGSGISIQEFMIVPYGLKTEKERIMAGSKIFHELKEILSARGHSTGVGDEGGFAPKLDRIVEAFELIKESAEKGGYAVGRDVFFAIDAAATSFFIESDNRYVLKPENVFLDRNRLISLYSEWIDKYPIVSIEDGLNENDWHGWAELNEKITKNNKDFMIAADDLTVTNIKRLKKAVKDKCANAVIIKPNQIGTLTETVECVNFAKKSNWKTIVSHRSGETCDSFITDFAVASGADFLKAGSLSRGERLVKYNRLMHIEEEIENKC